MKKISALLIFVLTVICCCISASAVDVQASLYSYYGNNMLFKQNDEAVFAGKATAGSEIEVRLYNSQNEEVAKSTAFSDGTFSVSFTAPEGSFEEYRVVLTADGTVFKELTGVVFGELWLASGQSNMEFPLWKTVTGSQMVAEGKVGSDALRFFYVPFAGGEYNGSIWNVPAEPLVDYQCTTGWYKGSDAKVYELSAIGYYFAENLIKELNMPVGIIHANLSGTPILSWISRQEIENNADLLAECKSDGFYVPLESWNEYTVDAFSYMSGNFNKFIAPLKNFRLSGMLWYQGEADIQTYWKYGRYTRAFDALQDSYTEYFSYKDGKLPIIFSQLACYMYGEQTLVPKENYEFANIQQSRPESRAMVSILDVPLDYRSDFHAVHPIRKKEVGDKMFYAAMGLVYGKYDTYTAATPSNVEIKDESIYITFKNVGDTLLVDGDKLSGFTICGEDGVYVPAKAEIVSYNTVRVYNSSVREPKSAAYAYTQYNGYVNLFASVGGEKKFAVSPFVTDMNYNAHYWHNDSWTSCDYETFWHCHENEYTGFYNTWNAEGADIAFVKSEIDSGNALNIKATASQFNISPNFIYYNIYGNPVFFQDADLNWSDYGALRLKIKVNEGQKVQFDGLAITLNNGMCVYPAIKDTDDFGCIIEGDGTVKTITLDMNRLYVNADITAEAYNSDILKAVTSAKFVFTDVMGSGVEFSVDDFAFISNSAVQDIPDEPDTPVTPETPNTPSEPDVPENPEITEEDSCDHLCHESGFMGFIWKIINFFNKLFKSNKTCACGVNHY